MIKAKEEVVIETKLSRNFIRNPIDGLVWSFRMLKSENLAYTSGSMLFKAKYKKKIIRSWKKVKINKGSNALHLVPFLFKLYRAQGIPVYSEFFFDEN